MPRRTNEMPEPVKPAKAPKKKAARKRGRRGSKMLILQGALYTGLGIIPPVQAMMMTDIAMTTRNIIIMILAGLAGGGTALKAFLSTNFAESNASRTDNDDEAQ